MKKYYAVIVHFLIVCICYAQNQTYSDYEKNVLAFNAQGIKLGDTYSAFKEKFPDATYMSDASDDINKVYAVGTITNVTVALFYFVDDSLYAIRYGYDVKQANKLGGWDVIAENFVKKYGRFDSVDSNMNGDTIFEAYRKYSAINRYLQFWVTKQTVLFEFQDTNLAEKLRQRKMNSMDYGF